MLQRYPPCTGWNSPLYDLAMEPGYSLWPQSRISSLGRRMTSLVDPCLSRCTKDRESTTRSTRRRRLGLRNDAWQEQGGVLVPACKKVPDTFEYHSKPSSVWFFWQDTSDLGVSSSLGVYARRANAQSASDCIVLPKWRILGDLVKTENKVTKPTKPMSFLVAFSAEACDLALKFPHVSVLPFKLHSFRGSGVYCCFRLYFGALT